MPPRSGDAALETILDDIEPPASPPPTAGSRGGAVSPPGQRLLECTAELLETTPWRSIKVIDIARQAGTSPATFYQYFENVEQAILVLAEELIEGAGELAELVEGDWSEDASWDTARQRGRGLHGLLGVPTGRCSGWWSSPPRRATSASRGCGCARSTP